MADSSGPCAEPGNFAGDIRDHSTADGIVRQVLAIVFLLLGVLCTAGFGPPRITDGAFPPLRLDPDQVTALSRVARPPTPGARSALVVDLDSGQVLYALRPHDRLPPASTVKIMTALVVLERSAPEDVVTVSANAAGMEGSRMGLQAGESLSVLDLLYGLLLPSGNDAAVALAEHVAGSEAAFVQLMNEKAAALGMADTRFANAHGLDDPTATISAADLITVTREALAYPVFARIVASPRAEVAGRTLVNTNELLTSYPGADGVKTGTTDAAGECLVGSVAQGGHRTLVALLGSQDRYREAAALLDYAAAHWEWRRVDLPDDALAWEVGPDGRRYRLRAIQPADLLLMSWQWPLTHLGRTLDWTVPPTATLPVGTLTLSIGAQPLAHLPLAVWQGP